MNHGEVVGGSFLVACGDAAELLEAVDQAHDPVALAVGGLVEGGLAFLALAGRDHGPDVTAAQAAQQTARRKELYDVVDRAAVAPPNG